MGKTTLVLLTFLFLCASRAHAQGVFLGPELGIYNARDADAGKILGGVALRAQLGPALGIEGSLHYRQEDYLHGGVSVRTWPVMVTGLLYPIPIAYGAIGAGWYNTTIDYHADKLGIGNVASETKQRFGWHFGAGMDIPVGSNAKLVGDIRYVFLNYDFKTVPGSSGLNSDFYVITLGLLFGI